MSYEINFGPWGSIFAVPTAVADRYLKFCTEEQLKVLLLALRQGQGPVDTAGIAARLGMDEAAVTDCLQYWQESGLFTESQNPQPAKEAPKAPENNENAVVKTTENGITTIRSRGHLSPGEINTMLREDKRFAALAAELEAARGSVLSPSEREILAYLFGSLELSPEYLLVDGYNIIFAWEELAELAKTDLDAARHRLIQILCNYQGYRRCELILVFDAYKVKGNPGNIERQHGIHVVYTKEAETADMYIEKVTHTLAKEHRVRVATSDGLEQIIILGHGAVRVPARQFREEVEQVERAIREILESL